MLLTQFFVLNAELSYCFVLRNTRTAITYAGATTGPANMHHPPVSTRHQDSAPSSSHNGQCTRCVNAICNTLATRHPRTPACPGYRLPLNTHARTPARADGILLRCIHPPAERLIMNCTVRGCANPCATAGVCGGSVRDMVMSSEGQGSTVGWVCEEATPKPSESCRPDVCCEAGASTRLSTTRAGGVCVSCDTGVPCTGDVRPQVCDDHARFRVVYMGARAEVLRVVCAGAAAFCANQGGVSLDTGVAMGAGGVCCMEGRTGPW